MTGPQPERPPIPVQYVVSYEKPKVNHVLHLLLTIFTFGLWAIVWLAISIDSANKAPQQRVSGVYGPAYPGHPGPAGVPQLPASEQQMLNPRPPRAYDPGFNPAFEQSILRKSLITIIAVGGLLTLIAATQGGWGWFIAFIFAAITTGGVIYRARQLQELKRRPAPGEQTV